MFLELFLHEKDDANEISPVSSGEKASWKHTFSSGAALPPSCRTFYTYSVISCNSGHPKGTSWDSTRNLKTIMSRQEFALQAAVIFRSHVCFCCAVHLDEIDQDVNPHHNCCKAPTHENPARRPFRSWKHRRKLDFLGFFSLHLRFLWGPLFICRFPGVRYAVTPCTAAALASKLVVNCDGVDCYWKEIHPKESARRWSWFQNADSPTLLGRGIQRELSFYNWAIRLYPRIRNHQS